MVQDQYVGSVGSNPDHLTVLNDKLYFTANSSYTNIGVELNQYDGSLFTAIDIFPGATGSNISGITVLGNMLLFSAENSVSAGNEFWMSAGLSNPLEIANINPGANLSSNPSLIRVSGNSAYFAASFDANGDGIDDPVFHKYTAPDKLWTGSVSTDASNANNWFPVGAPASTDNVLFPANPTNSFSSTSFLCKDFINNGSIINIGGSYCFISGVFYNAGTINNSALLSITSDGTDNLRSIGSPGIFNGQLSLAGGLKVGLVAPVTVTSLNVSANDTFFLGSNNLQSDGFDNQIPKIITDSSGSFMMPVGALPVTFPVSADVNSYNPVVITNSGTSDYFGVNVSNGVYTNGTSGNLVSQQAVNKTWNIYELTPGCAPMPALHCNGMPLMNYPGLT